MTMRNILLCSMFFMILLVPVPGIRSEDVKQAVDPSKIITAEEMKKEIDQNGRVVLHQIQFGDKQAYLTLEDVPMMNEIVRLLLDNPDLNIEIQLHTDNRGSRRVLALFSDIRAKRIQSYLQAFNIADDRVTIKGMGLTQPIASNGTEEGRAMNRRIELVKR
ncbi:OmpA family protein [bacterium]|nr:OmpA family protein [candidate division CSSED10-310 bacterium]